MESDGPYDLEDEMLIGSDGSYRTLETRLHVAIANCAYADGRQSMEKDFKELLDFANSIENAYPGRYEHVERFKAWKKARGIE